MSRPRLSLQLWLLPLLVLATVHGQEKLLQDPAAVPTVAVQQLLDDAAVASDDGDAAKALDLADRALIAAQQAADVPGEAQAQRIRAAHLLTLDRSNEAQVAWHDAEAAWKRIANAPGQIEALGWQAVIEMRGGPPKGAELLRRAIALAKTETSQLRAVAPALLDVGRALVDRSFLSEAQQTFETLVTLAEATDPGSLELASGLSGLGSVAFERGNLTAALDYYQRAHAIRENLVPNSLDFATSISNLGRVAWRQGALIAARDYFQRALTIREKLAPNSLDVANSLAGLGVIARMQGDLGGARHYHERGLAIRERRAPHSLGMAASLNNLGIIARQQGDLSGARAYYHRAIAIIEKLAPQSLDESENLSNLGMVLFDEGNLSAARDHHQRALAIREKLAPNSLDVAGSLNNLGIVASVQGDLSAARDYHQRSLAIKDRLAPNSLDVTTSLNNLGVIAYYQGDLSAARAYGQQVLSIREKLAPNSLAIGNTFNFLGLVAIFQGDLDTARDLYQRSLAIREKLAPNSLTLAGSLNNLGFVDWRQGLLDSAREHYDRALAITQKLAPDSLAVAVCINNLGLVARDQGRLAEATAYYKRALTIREKFAPNSLGLADNLHDLGRVTHEQGDLETAAHHTGRAWNIVRAHAALVTGDEARQAFESRYQSIGSQLVRFQIALGKTDEAFVTLEEGRAQALLQVMAERGISGRLAPADLWSQHELAQAATNQAGKLLEIAGEAEVKARIALEAEIAQQSAGDIVEEKRRLVTDRERETGRANQAYTQSRVESERRWADVRHTITATVPTPVGVAEARRSLPPDTLLVAFVVGNEGSTLFMLQRDGPIQAFPLPLALNELTARVNFVRGTVSKEAGARGLNLPSSDDVRIDAARTLYQKLFPAAAREAIRKAQRVLLSPDGVLWDLPFAALVINDLGTPQYLGLEKPLVYTQSLTAFAQAIQTTMPMRARRQSVLVVGNPLYDNSLRSAQSSGSPSKPVLPSEVFSVAGRRAQGELALLSREGEIPEPLPFAEEEANQIAALYGVRASTGIEPTEAWFRQRAAEANVIHLATHGYFNPFRAVSSGLRLAVPERDGDPGETDNDGALQAWEVFTQLELQADLVVLSACETGVGSKVPGEGLVGLTRAFQVAGAASIVATQWKVSDRSTATGMVAFHQSLRKGMAKDEALRQAMRKLANDPTTAHPYYWAPFVLVGDFRALRESAQR